MKNTNKVNAPKTKVSAAKAKVLAKNNPAALLDTDVVVMDGYNEEDVNDIEITEVRTLIPMSEAIEKGIIKVPAAALTVVPAAAIVAEVATALPAVIPAPAEVPSAPNFYDVSDSGLAKTVAYLTDKVAKGLVVCKEGNVTFLPAKVGETYKGKPIGSVEPVYYRDKTRNGTTGHWAYAFIKGRGKKGGPIVQDYWVDVLTRYVTIN